MPGQLNKILNPHSCLQLHILRLTSAGPCTTEHLVNLPNATCMGCLSCSQPTKKFMHARYLLVWLHDDIDAGHGLLLEGPLAGHHGCVYVGCVAALRYTQGVLLCWFWLLCSFGRG